MTMIGLGMGLGLALLAAWGFLVAAAVGFLVPLIGQPGALAVAGGLHLLIALAILLVLRKAAREQARRRRSRAAMIGLLRTALTVMPTLSASRRRAGVGAALGLVALAVILAGRGEGKD